MEMLGERWKATSLSPSTHLVTFTEINAHISGGLCVNLLLLGLHDIGEGCVPRLVEAKVGGEDGRKGRELDDLGSSVGFPLDGHIIEINLGSKGTLRDIQEAAMR